eukprot:Gb_28743 [translate_table: standard]
MGFPFKYFCFINLLTTTFPTDNFSHLASRTRTESLAGHSTLARKQNQPSSGQHTAQQETSQMHQESASDGRPKASFIPRQELRRVLLLEAPLSSGDPRGPPLIFNMNAHYDSPIDRFLIPSGH